MTDLADDDSEDEPLCDTCMDLWDAAWRSNARVLPPTRNAIQRLVGDGIVVAYGCTVHYLTLEPGQDGWIEYLRDDGIWQPSNGRGGPLEIIGDRYPVRSLGQYLTS